MATAPAQPLPFGPLKRFGEMVHTEPYNTMTSPRAVLIGSPQREHAVARGARVVADTE